MDDSVRPDAWLYPLDLFEELTVVDYLPSLKYVKKLAKSLIKKARSGDEEIIGTLLKRLPPSHHEMVAEYLQMSDTYWLIARELGFKSWSDLKHEIEHFD